MRFSMTNEMMREIIMDHYGNPRNKKETDNSEYQTIFMDSVSCIDKIYIQALVKNDVLIDVLWHGVGCAISTASTSIMTELLKGKTTKQAQYILDQYLKMIHEEPFDESVLDEAIVFMNTSRQPARIKCATIGWNGMEKILNGNKKDR